MTPAVRERPGGGEDCRCLCGSLLARVTPAGIELKCRRCKRVLVIPVLEVGYEFHREAPG